MKTQKRKAKCKSCNYQWGTRSKMDLVTCPNCLRKVKMEGEE